MTMDTSQVTFDLPDSESEIEFLREYMVPAWDRFEASDAFESGWFWRAGNFAHHDLTDLNREDHDLERLEPGMIYVTINGESEEVVATEREHWRAFEADGLLDSWTVQSSHPVYRNVREKMRDKYGRKGGDRVYKLRQIAAGMTVDLLAEFDTPLPMIGDASEENPVPIGYWAMTHFITKPQGYDWYQEIDACSKAIRNRLVSLAAFTSEEEARRALDEVLEELEACRRQFEE